jgi:ADP-ribose pyrophosphatase YjhB (NUDIX family)
MPNYLTLLDKVRSIAQSGLHHAENPYDRERYQQLLAIATDAYADLLGDDPAKIGAQFRRDVGYITPKVGVDGAVFDAEGRMLVVQRSDDGTWCLPCGWAEIGLSPEENVQREVREETGLIVEVKQLIGVTPFISRYDARPHSGYSMLYWCMVTGGALASSHETPNVGFYHLADVPVWHPYHQERAQFAYAFWQAQQRP